MCLFKRFFNLEKQVAELATKVESHSCDCEKKQPGLEAKPCDCENTIKGLETRVIEVEALVKEVEDLKKKVSSLSTSLKKTDKEVEILSILPTVVDRFHSHETVKIGVPFYNDEMDAYVNPDAVVEFGKVASELVREKGLEYVPEVWTVLAEDRVYRVHLTVEDFKEFIEVPLVELLNREDTFFYVLRRIVL